MSRPTPYKRSRSLEDKIIKRIHEGASFSDAPRLEDIDEATFRRWRQCEKESGDATLPLRDRRCWLCTNCTLQRKCDEAESYFRQSCVQIIHKAGQKNWRAMAWILEHRYRDEFTMKAVVELKEEEGERFDPTRALIEAITHRVAQIDEQEKQKQWPLRRPTNCEVSKGSA